MREISTLLSNYLIEDLLTAVTQKLGCLFANDFILLQGKSLEAQVHAGFSNLFNRIRQSTHTHSPPLDAVIQLLDKRVAN